MKRRVIVRPPAEEDIREIRQMRGKHFAYCGKLDLAFWPTEREADRELPKDKRLLAIQWVGGTHFSCLDEAMADYLKVIKTTAR